MSDIAVSCTAGSFDIRYLAGDFLRDDGLETAIILSLFTDGRVTQDEVPLGENDRRGWWGDIVPEIEGDRIGSRLWLLNREKLTELVQVRAREYARESLQWLLDDGVAEAIDVESEIANTYQLSLLVNIKRPGAKNVANFRFQLNWDAQAAKGK